MVASPRILAAPAALECRRHTTLQVGPAREIILGEVVGVFVRSDAVNASNLHIDQKLMDAVGRMGGPPTAGPDPVESLAWVSAQIGWVPTCRQKSDTLPQDEVAKRDG